MISDISDLGPLASGDHHALRWKLHVNTVPDETTRYVFDYGRSDLCKIKTELAKQDWHVIFSNKSVEDCWCSLKDILQDLESRYVPVKKVKCKNGKPMWLSHKALKAIKHRHKIFQKYKNSSHPACKNANAIATRAIHQSRRNFERRLRSKIKDDKKSFFAYARGTFSCAGCLHAACAGARVTWRPWQANALNAPPA